MFLYSKLQDREIDKQKERDWKLRVKKGRGKPLGLLEVEIDQSNKIRASITEAFHLSCLLSPVYPHTASKVRKLESENISWVMIFPLLLYTMIFCGKEAYIDYIANKEFDKINKGKAYRSKVYREKNGVEIREACKWEEIKLGDIIRVEENEIFPADVVILNTSENSMDRHCWVDTHGLDGFMQMDYKKSITGTKHVIKQKDYRWADLEGKLQYEPPHTGYDFNGTFKNDTDFHQENLSIQNFVLRGSVLRNTSYVDAICVYTGKYTKIMLQTPNVKGKHSYFEKLAEKFFVLGIFFVCLMSLVSNSILLINRDDFQINVAFRDINYKNIFYFFVLYSPIVPISLYGVFDIIVLLKRIHIHRYLVEHTSKKKKAEEKIRINDPSVLADLGHVDYIFMDKTGTLTNAHYEVKNLLFNENIADSKEEQSITKLYMIDEKYMIESLQNEITMKKRIPREAQIGGHKLLKIDIATPKTSESTPETSRHHEIVYKKTQFAKMATSNLNWTPKEKAPLILKDFDELDEGHDNGNTHDNGHGDHDNDHSHDSQKKSNRKDSDRNRYVNIHSRDHEHGHESEPEHNKNNGLEQEEKKTDRGQEQEKAKESELENEVMVLPDNPAEDGEHENISEPFKNQSNHKEKTRLIYRYDTNQYIKDLCGERTSKSIDFFIKNLALCHLSKYDKKRDSYLTPYPIELGLLNFANHCGKKYIGETKKDNDAIYYNIVNDGEIEEYRILGYNEFTYSRKRSSVVYEMCNNIYSLTVKGAPENIKACLSLSADELRKFDHVMDSLAQDGLKVLVVAQKIMSRKEVEDYEMNYKMLKSNILFKANDIDEIANKFEVGCKVIGVVAMQDVLREGAQEAIQFCKDANLNLWLVSGDNRENTLNFAINSGIIDKDLAIRHLKVDPKDPKAVIRSVLDAIKGQYEDEKKKNFNYYSKTNMEISSMQNIRTDEFIDKDSKEQTKIFKALKYASKSKLKYALVVDYESFEAISKDPYCMDNFAFLCALATTVLTARFSPWQKQLLVKMVKERFPDDPIVMAVGDGLNDINMLKEADIGIEFRGNSSILPNYCGDIQLKSLVFFKELMLVHGIVVTKKIEKAIHYIFFCSMLFGLPIFFYSFYNNFTGTPLFESMFVFMFTFWFTSFPIIAFVVFDGTSNKSKLFNHPALYNDGRIRKQQAWFYFLITALSEGFVQAVIVFFVSIYTVDNSLSSEGWTADFGMSSLVQYYSIVIVANMKLFWHYTKHMKSFWFFCVFELASLVVYMIIHTESKFSYSDYDNQTQAIFKRAGPLLTIFFLVFFLPSMTYLVKHYIINKFFKTLYMWLEEKGHEYDTKEALNYDLLVRCEKLLDILELSDKMFPDLKNMDNLVEQSKFLLVYLISVASPAEEIDPKLNILTLKFDGKNDIIRRYEMIIIKYGIHWVRFLFPIGWLVLVGYMIGASIMDESPTYAFSRFAVMFAFFILGLIIYTKFYRTYFYQITGLLVLGIIAMKLIFDWTRSQDSGLMGALLPIVTGTIFNIKFQWALLLHLTHFVLYEIRLLSLYSSEGSLVYTIPNEDYDGSKFYLVWSYVLLVLFVHLLTDFLIYQYEKNRRIEHYFSSKLLTLKNTSGELLSLLMPDFLKDKYEEFMGETTYKELQDEPVALLFCEILDFHKILTEEHAENCVEILDKVFKEFDSFCKQFGVQKIETVGSSYVACAGLKAAEIKTPQHLLSVQPVRRLLLMTLEMLKFSKTNKLNKRDMKIWVGIHYGKCAAGVIGYHKPQFSLIGDTVNTTSRVCMLKTEGSLPQEDIDKLQNASIRLSNEAYEVLMETGGAGREHIEFIPIQNVKFKGKPLTTVYIVNNSESAPVNVATPTIIRHNRNSRARDAMMKRSSNQSQKRKSTLLKLPSIRMRASIAVTAGAGGTGGDSARSANTLTMTVIDRSSTLQKKSRKVDVEEEKEDVEEYHLIPSKFLLSLDRYSYAKRKAFYLECLQIYSTFYSAISLITMILYLLQSIFMFSIVPDSFERTGAIFGTRLGFVVMMLGLLFYRTKLFQRRLLRKANILIFIYGITVSLAQGYYTKVHAWQNIQLIEAILLYFVGTHINLMDLASGLPIAIAVYIEYLIIWGSGGILSIEGIFFCVVFIIINLILVYLYHVEEIQLYNVLNSAKNGDMKQAFLVSQLLPKQAQDNYVNHIAVNEKERNQKLHIYKNSDVTMLYTDIKGFTDFANSKEPTVVVEALGALYTKFDKMIFEMNNLGSSDDPKLYKLYTVGDAYIVLSFLDEKKRNKHIEAHNIVKIALRMRVAIEEVKAMIGYNQLSMRLGIHTGEIFGAIVGSDIVRYDIYGIDSKVANEMESESKENKINVSEVTKKILEENGGDDLYEFTENKEVELKKYNRSYMCYFIEPKSI